MKVLFLVAGLGMGGAEKVVSLLAGTWASRGWSVTVAAFDDPVDPIAHRFAPEIELVRLNIPPGRGSPWRGAGSTWRRLLALRRLMREQRPDVAISFLTKVSVLALLARTGLGVPLIISERNNPEAQHAHPLWLWAWKRLAGRAAAVVLQTEAIRRLYPRDIARRAVVIPNAVTIPAAAPAAERSERVLAAVGRLERQKGFDLLIPAFGTLAEAFPDWRLIIFGEGPERPRLESMVNRMGLSDRISLPGNSPEPGSWIRESDAFVLCSRFEGFPNVLVEAMMGGIPVVSFACNFGPDEILTHGVDGLLVPPESVADLVQELGKIMADQELRQLMGANARTSAARFATERVVSNWDSLVIRYL